MARLAITAGAKKLGEKQGLVVHEVFVFVGAAQDVQELARST